MLLDSSAIQDFQPIQRQLSDEEKPKTVLQRLLRRPIQSNGPDFYEHAPRPLPSGWERSTFQFEGLEIPYHVARAVQENAVGGSISGLKPDHAVSKKTVKADKKRGISRIWVNLPNPGRETGYIDFYKRLTHFFYTNPKSPLFTEFDASLPRIAHGHSTGATLIINEVTDKKTKDAYEDFGVIIPEALFLDNANAAEHDSLAMQFLFTTYAHSNKRKLPHETLLGLGYNNYYELKKRLAGFEFHNDASKIEKISFNASAALYLAAQTIKEKLGHLATSNDASLLTRMLTNHFIAAHNKIEAIIEINRLPSPRQFVSERQPSEFETPTFGQILETRKFGRQLRRRLLRDTNAKAATNIFMVASANDQFSSLKPQQEIAKKLGVPIYITQSVGHNPLSEDKAARKAAIRVIENLIPGVNKLPKAIRKTETPASEDYWPEYSRLGIAHKTLTNGFTRVVKIMPRLTRLRFRSMHRTQPESVRRPS